MSEDQCDKEAQCILHWFANWRRHEREKFLKVLLDKAVPSNVDTLLQAMNSVSVSDAPPSIFQCQLKLFNQWYNDWTPEQRQKFLQCLGEIDSDFMIKLNETIFNQSTMIS